MAIGFLHGQGSSSGGKEKELVVEIIETSQTWTVPEGVTLLNIWMCGGGVGGGGGKTGNSAMKGFGGSSGHARELILNVEPGTQYSVVIGAGSAGSESGMAGAQGGTTSFGSHSVLGGTTVPRDTWYYGGTGIACGGGADNWGTSPRGWQVYNGQSGGSGATGTGGAISGNSAIIFGSSKYGYCELTGETYCGAGSQGYAIMANNNATGNQPNKPGGAYGGGYGGGGIRTTNPGTTPYGAYPNKGGNGTTYGSGGGGGGYIYIGGANGEFYSAGGNGANGVVIIGYLA